MRRGKTKTERESKAEGDREAEIKTRGDKEIETDRQAHR